MITFVSFQRKNLMKGKPNFFLSMQLPLNVGLPHRQCDFCKRENAFCELQSREGHKIAFTKENEQQRFRINLSKSLFKSGLNYYVRV